MKNQLSNTWLTDKHIELEYKSYLVLAYLNEASNEFESKKLYPVLADLIQKLREMTSLKNQANSTDFFTRKINGFDLKNTRILYEITGKDESLFEEILNVIEFSSPLFEEQIKQGKKLFDEIESKMHIRPVGILPLHKNEGYFLFPDFEGRETRVYEYQVSVFSSSTENYKSLRTEYITHYSQNFVNTYESIKLDLIRNHKKFPVPAVFAIETEPNFPMEESGLPVAKRLLMQMIEEKI